MSPMLFTDLGASDDTEDGWVGAAEQSRLAVAACRLRRGPLCLPLAETCKTHSSWSSWQLAQGRPLAMTLQRTFRAWQALQALDALFLRGVADSCELKEIMPDMLSPVPWEIEVFLDGDLERPQSDPRKTGFA